MGKKTSQKHKKQRTPDIPPILMLRSRLDEFFSNSWGAKDALAIPNGLDAAVKGLVAKDVLPILLKAYDSTQEQVKEALRQELPAWLEKHGYTTVLLELLKQRHLDADSEKIALSWLAKLGIDVTALSQQLEQQNFFYDGYYASNSFQGISVVFWYTNKQHDKVQGMSFLLDFHPPWNGAVKDIAVLPQGPPRQTVQDFIAFWEERGLPLSRRSDTDIKKEIVKSLQSNQRENISLPQDLRMSRNLFAKYVLTLPDSSETAGFSLASFDALANMGKSAEELTQFEHDVGRMVRLSNGKEALMVGEPFENDEEQQ